MRYRRPPLINMTNNNGTTFLGLLALVFIVLKLTGFLDDWSWWYVTAPLWLPTTLFIGILALFGIMWCVTALVLWAIGH